MIVDEIEHKSTNKVYVDGQPIIQNASRLDGYITQYASVSGLYYWVVILALVVILHIMIKYQQMF